MSSEENKMKCNNCGKEIQNDNIFCANCGAQVVSNNNQVNVTKKKKFTFGKSLLICIGISAAMFFIFTIINVVIRISVGDTNSGLVFFMRSMSISLPVLIIMFGPIILYILKRETE